MQCSILIIKRPDDILVSLPRFCFSRKIVGGLWSSAKTMMWFREDYYNLSINAAVMLQRYSETWSEWVDVKVMEILDKDKIRVAVPWLCPDCEDSNR